MDKKPFDEKDIVALLEGPAGTVIKMISALPVNIVVEPDAVRKRHLKKIDEQLERIRLHRAVHEQHIIVVIIEPESVTFNDLDVIIFCTPILGHGSDFWIDLNAGYAALKPRLRRYAMTRPLPQPISTNESFLAR